ncbi:MAG: tetratricopeptide repeat protein [Muribaculaceae bacterium]|nr:tetratricopeptide repeat protein [Muribaculaceae bacterium]
MKKFLSLIFFLVIFSTYAVEFKQSFYNLLDKGDVDLAEIFLSEWESNDVENPDLFLAKFNLLIAKSFLSNEDSNINSDGHSNNPPLILEPNDSILQLAIETIKKGIEVFPNRLDFRLAEAQAYKFSEDYESLSKLGIDILEYSRINGCRWDWSEGESLEPEEGLKNMLDGIHAIEYSFITQTLQDNLLDLNLKYYPTDNEALLFKGMTFINAGKNEEACRYLEYAHEIYPEDDAVMFYLAVVYTNIGDKEKETEILNNIIKSEKADENIKKAAQAILEGKDANLKEIDLYRFEYSFLRYIANSCIPSTDSIDILLNKDNEIFHLLEQIGYYLPEEQKEIKIDMIGEGDEAIVVWTMPEPKEIPLARYIAFVPDKEANNYRLYTLERSLNWDGIDPVWILGYSYADGHSNFGEIRYPSTPEEFVDQVLKVMKSKK